jgi:hypothetical protein
MFPLGRGRSASTVRRGVGNAAAGTVLRRVIPSQTRRRFALTCVARGAGVVRDAMSRHGHRAGLLRRGPSGGRSDAPRRGSGCTRRSDAHRSRSRCPQPCTFPSIARRRSPECGSPSEELEGRLRRRPGASPPRSSSCRAASMPWPRTHRRSAPLASTASTQAVPVGASRSQLHIRRPAGFRPAPRGMRPDG